MKSLPNIAILADFDTTKRPRPHRMVQTLKESANVFVIARQASVEQGALCFSFPAPTDSASTRTKAQNDYIQSLCTRGEFTPLIYTKNRTKIPKILYALPKLNLIIVEDIALLPFACAYKQEFGSKIMVDLREFYPLEYENEQWQKGLGKFFTHLCAHYLPMADACLCVSEPIAARYMRDFGIKSEVYYSLPPFYALLPTPIHKPIQIIYHGLISKDRHSENLLDLAAMLGTGYMLNLMILSNDTHYLQTFKNQAKPLSNVQFLPPVELETIIPFCNRFDIGILSLEPNSFNNANAMPNKLFEYIQSRLCILSSPIPSISEFLGQFGVGIVAQDFGANALMRALNTLDSATIATYKAHSHKHAKTLSLESNTKRLQAIIQNLI